MTLSEPIPTAILLAMFGALMACSVLFSRAANRLGVPVVLLFMALGMVAGSEGLGLAFDDYDFAFRIGMIALVLILFDGGLNTPYAELKHGLLPASVLATVGVAGTAAIFALGAWWMGFSPQQAMLLGAVVSSTDAAAVFSVLRGSNLNLQKRVGTTLEVESCINDPMAVILTVAITESIISNAPLGWMLLWSIPLELVLGAAMGAIIGFGGARLLGKLRLGAGGLYPVLTLAIALLAFGVTTLIHGSGFVAVYTAAVILGNSAIPYRSGLTRIHDAIAWLGQITMFLVLGLLVYPSRLLDVMWIGLTLGLFLTFIARPLVVAICLVPFRFKQKEISYIGWVGLRGAVPIILATFPVMANVPEASKLFDVVFFVVVVNSIMPGVTLGRITRLFKLDVAEPPPPVAVLEINSMQPLQGEILSFFIDETLPVTGVPLMRVKFPEGSAIILVVRGEELMAARGYTVLEPGDHVYVFCRPDDRAHMELLFGRPE